MELDKSFETSKSNFSFKFAVHMVHVPSHRLRSNYVKNVMNCRTKVIYSIII